MALIAAKKWGNEEGKVVGGPAASRHWNGPEGRHNEQVCHRRRKETLEMCSDRSCRVMLYFPLCCSSSCEAKFFQILARHRTANLKEFHIICRKKPVILINCSCFWTNGLKIAVLFSLFLYHPQVAPYSFLHIVLYLLLTVAVFVGLLSRSLSETLKCKRL